MQCHFFFLMVNTLKLQRKVCILQRKGALLRHCEIVRAIALVMTVDQCLKTNTPKCQAAYVFLGSERNCSKCCFYREFL